MAFTGDTFKHKQETKGRLWGFQRHNNFPLNLPLVYRAYAWSLNEA